MKKYSIFLLATLPTLAMGPQQNSIELKRGVPSLTSLALSTVSRQISLNSSTTGRPEVEANNSNSDEQKITPTISRALILRNIDAINLQNVSLDDRDRQFLQEHLNRLNKLRSTGLPSEVCTALASQDGNILHEYFMRKELNKKLIIDLYRGSALSDNFDLFRSFLQRTRKLPPRAHKDLLIHASFYNDMQTLTYLIEHREEEHREELDPALLQNLLVSAAENDAKEVFDFLTATYSYADANRILLQNTLPFLILVARHNSTRILQTLLEAGIDQFQEEDGETPIKAALEDKATEAALLLVEHIPTNDLQFFKNTVNDYLWEAVHFGNKEVVSHLIQRIEAGSRITAQERRDIYEGGLDIPVNEAIINGEAEILNLLLASGAHIPIDITEDGVTIPVIFYALESYNGTNPDLLRTFMRHNVDINALSNDELRETVLHKASREGNLEFVRLLLEAGADTKLNNRNGETACDVASTDEIRAEIFMTSILATDQINDNQEISFNRERQAKLDSDQNLNETRKHRRF